MLSRIVNRNLLIKLYLGNFILFQFFC